MISSRVKQTLKCDNKKRLKLFKSAFSVHSYCVTYNPTASTDYKMSVYFLKSCLLKLRTYICLNFSRLYLIPLKTGTQRGMGLGCLSPPKQKYSPPPNEMKPISAFGPFFVRVMSRKVINCIIFEQIFFHLKNVFLKLQPKLAAPNHKNPGYVPA